LIHDTEIEAMTRLRATDHIVKLKDYYKHLKFRMGVDVLFTHSFSPNKPTSSHSALHKLYSLYNTNKQTKMQRNI